MSRMIKPASLLVTLVLLVAACNGAGASPTPVATTAAPATTAAATTAAPSTSPSPSPSEPIGSTGPASPSPSPSPTAPPGAVAGTLTIWADKTRTPILQAVGADFTATTQVPVQVYEIGFGDIRDRLATLGGHDAGPDIIIGAHDWLGKLVAAGVVEPLELDAALSDKFLKVGLDAFSYNGLLYGLPYVSEAVALYYNKDLVPTAPTTWDELKTKAKELQDAGTVSQGLCMQRGDPYHTYPLLTGFGGYIFGKNADGSYNPDDVGLDSPGGAAYAAELDQLVKDHLLVDNIDFAACETKFVGGDTAFWITGPWELKKFTDTAGLNFGVAPIPTMAQTPRPFVGVQGFMVNKFAPNKLLAETFLKEYIATDDTMRQLWEADPRLPVWKQLADQMTDPNIAAFTTSAAAGDPMPAIPQMDSVWKSWTDAINIVFGQTYNTTAPDAETVFKGAADQIRALIGQ